MSSFSQRLGVSQKQSIRQTLSPQMQKTMHLLGLSQDELEREVAEICEANPLITNQPNWSRARAGSAANTDWASRAEAPRHLSSHLLEQLALSGAMPTVRDTAKQIIAHLASDGRMDADDWAALSTARAADKALRLVQSFEPAGVAARSLVECFQLQLDPERAACPRWACLLAHLDELATSTASTLARRCGIDEVELRAMVDHIRMLDPHPGHRFDPGDPIEITPDLCAWLTPTGEWAVDLTWDPHAALVAEGTYRNWRSNAALPASAKAFLADKQAEADWLQRALKQRGQSLLRVARLAIARQYRFLTDGREHLAPLTMREIAAKLELHESTVSRAVAHKHILTPRGVLPMRSFFSTALSENAEDAKTSSAAVRARIGQLIGDEATPGAMSDSAISEALREIGIQIARRSVAKHREQLGLRNSRDRARLATYAVAAA
ncbi:RNA polymerase factor sigma-54 [Maricaulis sp.]|uniref:RNA polymerase factor sigma-54 n=1 Tax=Maricaulis sp. TaxID=1486257 RepID=UPI0025C1118A|nr:RNA polymerase factor sigma-54 [Maricaulis sp.]